MTKFLLSLIGFSIAMGAGILIMIHGYGLQPVSWGWIIGGNIVASLIGAIFQFGD